MSTLENNLAESVARNGAKPDAPSDGASGATTVRPPAAPAEHDLLTRRRDAHGNRLPWCFWYSIPTVVDVPLEETPLAGAIAAIRQTRPLLAASLHHFYDFKLRPRFRELGRVSEEEEQLLAAHNARAERENAAIVAQQEELAHARDQVTSADRERLVALDAPLAAAHHEAAVKVALTGGTYDPANPDEAGVLRHTPRAPEAVAADLRLPWTPADKNAVMPTLLAYFTTLLIGAMIGISVGILAGLLSPDSLTRQPFVTGGCALIGFAVALAGRWAIKLTQRQLSQRYYLGLSGTRWAPYLLLALVVDVGIILIDSYVEREGLLANMRLIEMVRVVSHRGAAANAEGGKTLVYFFAAILLTFPYVVFNAWEGYLSGRADACLNLIRARQAAEFAEVDAARRAQPEVQAALEAIARVKELLRQQVTLTARMAETAAPFGAKIAQLEAQRLAVQEELSQAAKQRVQDALDNFQGAQAEFDGMFWEARLECEPPAHWWWRLWYALRGRRGARRRGREQK